MRQKVLEKVEKIKDLMMEQLEVFDEYQLTGHLALTIHIKEGMINIVDISPKNTMKI